MSNVPNQNGSGLEQQVSTYYQHSWCSVIGKLYINKRQSEVADCRPTEDLLSIYNIVKIFEISGFWWVNIMAE
jgi:hypothetical protein